MASSRTHYGAVSSSAQACTSFRDLSMRFNENGQPGRSSGWRAGERRWGRGRFPGHNGFDQATQEGTAPRRGVMPHHEEMLKGEPTWMRPLCESEAKSSAPHAASPAGCALTSASETVGASLYFQAGGSPVTTEGLLVWSTSRAPLSTSTRADRSSVPRGRRRAGAPLEDRVRGSEGPREKGIVSAREPPPLLMCPVCLPLFLGRRRSRQLRPRPARPVPS